MSTRLSSPPAGPRVLLVEDNRALAANTGEYLEETGCIVDFAHDGRSALQLLAQHRFDVVVLDLALPRIDGLEVCARVRAACDTRLPVLMLTARDTLDDKLKGFAAGADDYLTKPFALAELRVRIDALLRRLNGSASILRVGDLQFDAVTCEARRGSRCLRLTPLGVRLLEVLLRHAPAFVSREDIEFALWGEDPPDNASALRVHVHALRRVIDTPGERPLLHTMPGTGYAIRAP